MKVLSRKEVDKLLERNQKGRPATHSEILLLQEAIENRKSELKIKKNDKLSKVELEKIIEMLGLEDIEIILM